MKICPIKRYLNNTVNNDYATGFRISIDLPLRRTLLRFVLYSAGKRFMQDIFLIDFLFDTDIDLIIYDCISANYRSHKRTDFKSSRLFITGKVAACTCNSIFCNPYYMLHITVEFYREITHGLILFYQKWIQISILQS